MDTRNKRASALGFALAALIVLPSPDGTISQPDRQQVTASYAGLAAGSVITLNICVTSVASLNPVRAVVSLTLDRSVKAICS